ncbi:DUF2207 domain-containing protein [Antiquaquibacter oligotrophicus]|nr:DUF2207 domain-containing protein [Antiquaquibacter oligotrophicus]UDF13649.1 DUF2207 domain-containing protein [Antiquaquibacter oligotrophicus]
MSTTVLAAAPVSVQAASTTLSAVAGVDDFTFESLSVDYYLDVDENGRSTLRTVEEFVAVFPEYDQNRGMRRAIPSRYLGAPTDVDVLSVTNENGDPRPFEVETDDDGFVLVTSAARDYVHGAQTYVFTYTQRNVTRYFENTDADEFYWDTNGTGWAQPFGSVTARVHVPQALADSLTGDAACYYGFEGSTNTCDLQTASEPDGVVLTSSVSGLGAYQNMTLSVGFEPGTFVPRDDSYFGSYLGWLQLVSLLGVAFALVLAIVLRSTTLADAPGRPTIIAEYTPPREAGIMTSAVILGKTRKAVAAMLVDMAVRGHIRIVESPAQGWFARGNDYLLELLDPTGLDESERDLATALFGWELAPGTGYLMSKSDTVLSQRVRALVQMGTARASQQDYRSPSRAIVAALPIVLVIGATVATFLCGVFMVDNAIGGPWPLILVAPAVVAVFVVFGLVVRVPLTAKGSELRDHLKGLQLYIRLAEADRLRMLQSPTGAERETVSTTDPRQVLDLYEKLLPYAVLFSLEREWAQELSRYYTEENPHWYSGTSTFNAAVFASSIGSMASSVSSSYSGSSSSSSSGGSGGGGSSGGGGGGGGGGGV